MPAVAPEIIRFVRSQAWVNAADVVHGLSAEGGRIGYDEAAEALVKLEEWGIVAKPGPVSGRRQVLKPASRGDIGILTRDRCSESLSHLNPAQYATEWGSDFIKIIERRAGIERVFYDIRDLDEYCRRGASKSEASPRSAAMISIQNRSWRPSGGWEMREVELSFHRLLSIWWLLVWRGLLCSITIGVLAGFIAGFLVTVAGHKELSVIAGGYAGLALSPFLGLLMLHWALKKQYKEFRIVFVTTDHGAAASAKAA